MRDGMLERLLANRELRDGLMNKGAAAVLADDAAIEELRAMSAAAIDRYLRGARKGLEPLAKSATRRSSCALRNEIPFGTSHAPVDRPGHLSIDTVAHCGSTLKGDCLWTLNSMDVLTGWTETVTVRNKTARWVRHGHEEILPAIPFKVLAANYDGGSEFINAETAGFSKLMHYQMTRSRPYRSNDNAHVEQRNGDAVRRYDFRYRYEDAEATGVLNRLWYWASLRKNYLVPWRKCVGHTKTRSGRTRGACDSPKTPCQRALESGHVSAEKKAEAEKTLKGLNDAHVTRKINELQHALLGILSDKAMLEFVDEAVRAVTAA